MLEVAESVEMKVDEYRHDFRPAHSPFPIAVLTPVWLTNGHACNFLIIFLAKIIDNTENFRNFGRTRQTLWGGRTDANPKLPLNDI